MKIRYIPINYRHLLLPALLLLCLFRVQAQGFSLTASGNSPVCQWQTIQLQAQSVPGATYQWTGPNGFFSTQQNPQIGGAQSNQGGLYEVSASFNGQTQQASVWIDVVAPQVSVSYTGAACTGGSIRLQVSSSTPGASFQWMGPNFSSTQPDPVISNLSSANTGIYFGIVTSPDGCQNYAEVFVDVKNCCISLADTSRVRFITSPLQITANQSWNGAYYIHNLITVSSGAVLDLTNTDLIFAQCAGIVVEPGARIRANNAVFRSCDPATVWRGVELTNSYDNVFNECTFINAQHALWLEDSEARIANNLFQNNRVGVFLQNCILNAGITGNVFEVNNNQGNYADADCIPSPGSYSNDHYGIYLTVSELGGQISHNRFINSLLSPGKRFTGIFASASAASISQNQFSNLFRSVEVSTVRGAMNLLNNRMEVLNGPVLSNNHQILLSGVDLPALVFNNIISDANPSTAANRAPLMAAGIFAENSRYLRIKKNRITGFYSGIEVREVANSVITENSIDGSHNRGITAINLDASNISCNEINMRFGSQPVQSTLSTVGIYLFQSRGPAPNDTIYSNCVRSSHIGIWVNSNASLPASARIIPEIRNNYVYHYLQSGIRNDNFSGSIGTAAAPGMNTLFANRPVAAGVVDIRSNVNISASGNELLNVQNVSLGSAPTRYSTAACGSQIGNPTSQGSLNTFNKLCDTYAAAIIPLSIAGNRFELDKDAQNKLMQNKQAHNFNVLLSMQGALDTDDALRFHDMALGLPVLTASQRQWLAYYLQIKKRDFTAARRILSAISGDEDLRFVEQLRLQLYEGRLPAKGDEPRLRTLAQAQGATAPMAGALLSLVSDYRPAYPLYELPLAQDDKAAVMLSTEKEFLEVYPNPASSQLNVKFYVKELKGQVELLDMLGRRVKSLPLEVAGGVFSLDISDLKPGTYLIAVQTAEGFVQKARFVKQ